MSHGSDTALFTPEMEQQLHAVFEKMAAPLQLQLHLDESAVSQELEEFISALCGLTDKLTLAVAEPAAPGSDAPWVSLCTADGTETGLGFHGVPSGHEFTSFVLGLYNAAGPGQPLADETRSRIDAISSPVNMKLLVTLSCTLCPELVTAAQRIAAASPWVTAHVYDIRHFPGLKEQYQVMSVPCLVLNNTQVFFGKKSVEELLGLIAPA